MASGGARSLLAPWIGGAGAPQPSGGCRSLFAFWMGGACSTHSAPTPTPTPEPVTAGGTISSYRHKVAHASIHAQTKPPRLVAPIRATVGVTARVHVVLPKPTVHVSAKVGVKCSVSATVKLPKVSIVCRQYDFSEDELLAVLAAVTMMKDRDAPSS